jgi:5-hydroxyisourate hydrolase-like protein (transthyretin family)
VCGRGLILLLCVLALFLLLPQARARAASLSTGRITGKVLDGSNNNAPVANQKVTLQLAENNTARDFITLATDAQGSYTFSALQSDSTVQYAIYTLYQGAQYTSDLIDLSKNADQQVNLTVYDATSSTQNIAVVQATILLDKPNTQAGTLTVSEDYFFENLGKTTYVGQVDASHGKPDALSFSLPPGAKFLSLGDGFDGYTGTQVNTGFATNAAVLPGTSRFSFSFQVPYTGTSYHFTYKALYPTVNLSLLTPTNFQTTPQGLDPKGPTNTQSGTYNMYQALKLSANTSIQAQLEGLPAQAKSAQPQSSTLNPGLLWLVVLLIVLLALSGIGGYLYNNRRRKAASGRRKPQTPARKDSRAATSARKHTEEATSKEALLQELLELDKAFEARKVKKAAYYEQRGRLKARLRKVMDEEQSTSKQRERGRETSEKVARSSGKGEK